MPPTTCKALIKDYCRNCSFAGIRYIADEEKHWCERWFWFVLVALAWYGSALLIIAAWNAYTLSPISFGVETTYIDWDTKMPAVAVCETSNDDMLYNVSDTIWPPGHLLDLEDALKEITYFRGLSYKLVNRCYLAKNPDPLCPTANFSHYASLVRSPCHKILRSCSYNKHKFECCEYFQPIDTDMGRCFIINSLQTENPNHRIPMVSNITNKNGFLRFEVLIPSSVYTIGEDEVPTITTLQSSLITTVQSPLKLKKGYHHQRRLAVRNIVNDPLIVQTTPAQRACRLHHENEDGLYPYYSYSACTVLCRKRAQIDLCKCNDHFMLGTSEEERCNITGMSCLHFHENHLTILKPKWASRAGLSCNCVPSCHETEITVIKDVVTANRKDKTRKANVEVVLAYLPTERFKRSVVRSSLDLVVSIGGTTGLFLGASLLSFAEVIVYFTVRFITNIWIEHQKRRRVTVTQTRINQPAKFSTGFQHGRNKNYRSQFTYLS